MKHGYTFNKICHCFPDQR